MKNISTGVLLLDGAMGTELERRGYVLDGSLWSATANDDVPELVKTIHCDYINAGADVITTNTFRSNARAFRKHPLGVETARRNTISAVELAVSARSASAKPGVLIAGSDAPVEDCYRPDLVPSDDQLFDEHREHIQWMVDAGCDVIILETMNTLREAIQASRAASDFNLPFYVSLVPDESGTRLLSGEMLADGISELEQFHPRAILTNCASPAATVAATRTLRVMHDQRNATWRYGGYANGGVPDPVNGYLSPHAVSLISFVQAAVDMRDNGATVIGSCCQTTPEWTRALRTALDSVDVKT